MFRMLPLIAAAASINAIDVPETLGNRVDKAKDRSGIPVLLPDTIKSSFPRLYPTYNARQGQYTLDLGAAKGCNGATACFVAAFLGNEGAKLYGRRRVRLAHGITGRFVPTRCGASCAPPQVVWLRKGVRYTVQVKGLPEKSERKGVVKVANSAIRNGPR